MYREELFWVWLAGFIDGEGCILLYKHRNPRCRSGYQWQALIDITQANKQVLEYIKDQIKSGRIHETRPGKWSFKIYSNGLRQILPKILPFLKVKNNEVSLQLEALKYLKRGRRTTFTNAILEKISQQIVGVRNA